MTHAARVDRHATVKIGDFTIPLIGIPHDATEAECDLCHDLFHIQSLKWNEAGSQLLCEKCRKP